MVEVSMAYVGVPASDFDPSRDYDDRNDDQDDSLDENGNFKFECARFWIKGEGWYCPMAGTEECDWECPN